MAALRTATVAHRTGTVTPMAAGVPGGASASAGGAVGPAGVGETDSSALHAAFADPSSPVRSAGRSQGSSAVAFMARLARPFTEAFRVEAGRTVAYTGPRGLSLAGGATLRDRYQSDPSATKM